MLDFQAFLWYNKGMETKTAETRNAEAVTIPRAEYEQMQGRISVLEKQVELLTEALRLSRQKRFGASSERSSGDAMEQLSLLFNEAEVCVDQAAEEDDGSVAVAAHKRRKKNEYTLDHLPENVPVEVVEHRLPEEERICPECGSAMTEIGKEVRRRLKLEPPKAVVVEDRYYTYALPEVREGRHRDASGESGQRTEFYPRQLCHDGGRGRCHGAEVCYGFTHVLAGE